MRSTLGLTRFKFYKINGIEQLLDKEKRSISCNVGHFSVNFHFIKTNRHSFTELK